MAAGAGFTYDPYYGANLQGQAAQQIGGDVSTLVSSLADFQKLKQKERTDADLKKRYYDTIVADAKDKGIDPTEMNLIPPNSPMPSDQYVHHNATLAQPAYDRYAQKQGAKNWSELMQKFGGSGGASAGPTQPAAGGQPAAAQGSAQAPMQLPMPPQAPAQQQAPAQGFPGMPQQQAASPAAQTMQIPMAPANTAAPATPSPAPAASGTPDPMAAYDQMIDMYSQAGQGLNPTISRADALKGLGETLKAKQEYTNLTLKMKVQQADKERLDAGNKILDAHKSGQTVYDLNGNAIDALDATDVIEKPEKYTLSPRPPSPGAGGAGGKDALSPDEEKYYAQEIAANRMDPNKLPQFVSKFRGGDSSMANILMKAKKLAPDNQGLVEASRNAKSYLGNTKAAQATMTFFANMQNIEDAIDALPPQATMKQLNRVLNAGHYDFGNVPVTNLKTLYDVVGPEMGSSLGSGQAAVARDALSKASLNENAPVSGLKAALQTVRQVETNRIVSVMLDSGEYGKQWLREKFGTDTANQLIDQEEAKRKSTVQKALGASTKVVNGVTYTKGSDGLWHKQ